MNQKSTSGIIRRFSLKLALILGVLFLATDNVNAQCCSVFNDQFNQIQSVNTFYPAPQHSIISSGATSLVLGPVPQVDQFGNSYGTQPISTGDLVLIIQMQGATFNSGNSSLYGANLANAGPDALG